MDTSCYRCGQEGHTRSGCPSARTFLPGPGLRAGPEPGTPQPPPPRRAEHSAPVGQGWPGPRCVTALRLLLGWPARAGRDGYRGRTLALEQAAESRASRGAT
jgi:hypothetical protein